MTAMDPASFAKEAYQELKKSTWLTREQAVQSTFGVVLVVVMMAAYAGILDFVLAILVQGLLGGPARR